jgi:hypothetical protein
MSYNKRVMYKIRSARGPLIMGLRENEGIWGFWPGLDWFFWPNFGKVVQRRGVHVNTPKIGSRDGELCIGGILDFYADL